MLHNILTTDRTKLRPSDSFFLDTNVILYLHHPPSTNSNPFIAENYSNFVAHLMKTGCTLRVSSFNIQEAFHVVETIALNDHNRNASLKVKRKAFRRQHRSRISMEQESLWSQMKNNYTIENAIIDRTMLESFIKNYTNNYYDPIDYLFTINHPSCNIITTDSDFSSDSSLSLYTL